MFPVSTVMYGAIGAGQRSLTDRRRSRRNTLSPQTVRGIYSPTSGPVSGGHFVTVVGYDHANQYLIAKNSWGSNKVPSSQASGSDYQISVTSTSNSAYTSQSGASFTIAPPPDCR